MSVDLGEKGEGGWVAGTFLGDRHPLSCLSPKEDPKMSPWLQLPPIMCVLWPQACILQYLFGCRRLIIADLLAAVLNACHAIGEAMHVVPVEGFVSCCRDDCALGCCRLYVLIDHKIPLGFRAGNAQTP